MKCTLQAYAEVISLFPELWFTERVRNEDQNDLKGSRSANRTPEMS
jgi:hypothetical protein